MRTHNKENRVKYNLKQTFKDLEDQTIMTGPKETEKPLTLGVIISMAGLNADPQKYPSGQDKYKIYKLIRRANSKAEEIEFSAEDISLIKELIAHAFTPYVVGVAYDALEQVDEPV
jgi:hypothetical protein